MNNIERLAQISQINNKRDVGFRSTLCTGNHVDTITAQRVEQLAGDARSMLHVLAHNSHRGKVALGGDVADVAGAQFVHKLVAQHLNSLFGIGILHGKRSVVLRRSLRHKEDAHAVASQCIEDARINANHAHHAKSGEGDKAGVVNRRYTLDGLALDILFIGDERTRSRRVERILY